MTGRSWLMVATGLVAAVGSVLEDEGDSREGGGGTEGGGGGTTSWVFDEAVGDPGGGAGTGVSTPAGLGPRFLNGEVCLVMLVAPAVAAVVSLV